MPKKLHESISHSTPIQNINSWELMTSYRATHREDDALAYKSALNKAAKTSRQVMIRSYSRDGYTYWEVWRHCA